MEDIFGETAKFTPIFHIHMKENMCAERFNNNNGYVVDFPTQ